MYYVGYVVLGLGCVQIAFSDCCILKVLAELKPALRGTQIIQTFFSTCCMEIAYTWKSNCICKVVQHRCLLMATFEIWRLYAEKEKWDTENLASGPDCFTCNFVTGGMTSGLTIVSHR